MSKHTPGPWQFSPFGSVWSSDSKIAQVKGVLPAGRYRKFEQEQADARLIAAAPDMLAALQCLLKDLGTGFDGMPSIGMCRAAVAKATGSES